MVAILEAIKQSFLSCDELEENNYLKEDSKAGTLQALLSVLDFRSLNNSCNFSKITLHCWKHPSFSVVFLLLVLLHIQIQGAQAVVHSLTNRLVGRSWWWAVAWGGNPLHWCSQGRNYVAPCLNIFINGYSPVISYVVFSSWAYPFCSKSRVLNLWHFSEF